MADFSFVPQIVTTKDQYNQEVTESENFKIQIQEIDSTIKYFYTLDFGMIQLAVAIGPQPSRNALRSHYEGQNHMSTTFSWTNPPSYIPGYVAPMTVRYWAFEDVPIKKSEGYLWEVKIVLRKEV